MNRRSICRDCYRGAMTEKVTVKTPRLMVDSLFCQECSSFWQRLPDSLECLECFEKTSFDILYLGLAHKPTCGALRNPCECGVRNKKPNMSRCGPCSGPIFEQLRKERQDDYEKLPRKQRSGGKHSSFFDGPSPLQDNAMKNLED